MCGSGYYYDPEDYTIVRAVYYIAADRFHFFIYQNKDWLMYPAALSEIPERFVRINTDEHLELLKTYV